MERNSEVLFNIPAVEALTGDSGYSETGDECFEVTSSVEAQAEDSLYFFYVFGEKG